jgi:hypothetical protein
MEASDPAVSVDLLIRALFAAGAKRKDIAKAIAKSESLAAQHCGPHFCSMKITQDVREHAAQKEINEQAAIVAGI